MDPTTATPTTSNQYSPSNNNAPKFPVGKKELLQWAAKISANPKCSRLDDLKDGTILLRIFSKIWPKVVDLKKIKWKVRGRNSKRRIFFVFLKFIFN